MINSYFSISFKCWEESISPFIKAHQKKILLIAGIAFSALAIAYSCLLLYRKIKLIKKEQDSQLSFEKTIASGQKAFNSSQENQPEKIDIEQTKNPVEQEKNPVEQEENPVEQEKNPVEQEKNPVEQEEKSKVSKTVDNVDNKDTAVVEGAKPNESADLEAQLETQPDLENYDQTLKTLTSLSEVFAWHRKNAEDGLPKAQYNLGLCYQHGLSVTIDVSEARNWYTIAAKAGFAEAESELDSL